jgi:ABC-type transport system involved in multi-copper enzyme maturation permease subunit
MTESSFRSPFAALVWKEWRESWWLLALMVFGPAVSYCAFRTTNGKGVALVGLCLLALFLGAGLFAGERAQGTSAFQTEQPVRRGAVWNAKLLMPVLALAAGELLFAFMAFRFWPDPGWSSHKAVTVDLYVYLLAAFLFLASAVLCSVLLDRSVTAWAAGGILGIIVLIGQGLLFVHFLGLEGQSNNWRWPFFLCLLFVEAIGLLWLSRVAYIRWARD